VTDHEAAELALTSWTGRTYLRKSRGRACAHWITGERCSGGVLYGEKCRPPRADHCTTWGFGRRLKTFRVLCSQPYGEDFDEQALEVDAWARAWGLTALAWPGRSWWSPGSTTLHVFVPDAAAREMAGRADCPACENDGERWARRDCCWTAEILGGWEARLMAAELMEAQ